MRTSLNSSLPIPDVFRPPTVTDLPPTQGDIRWTENDWVIRKSPPIFIKNITNLNALNHYRIYILGSAESTFIILKDFLKMKTLNKNKKIMEYLNII